MSTTTPPPELKDPATREPADVFDRPVRIGCVKYLNTLPLAEGLSAWSQAEVVSAVPSKLIGMLESGEVDIALASVIDAARSRVDVTLLPAGMIGSDGRTFTVRLFSRVPIEQITRLAVDTDSHTSAALARVVLDRRYRVQPEVTDFHARERVETGGASAGGDWPEAVLLIGDKVVTDPPPEDVYPHTLDLGEAWKELTGLPFVYACWMCRSEDAGDARVRHAAALLDRQRRHNATRLDWIVASRAGDRHWPTDVAADYVGRKLRYDVNEAARLSAEKFIAAAASLGLCERDTVAWAQIGVG